MVIGSDIILFIAVKCCHARNAGVIPLVNQCCTLYLEPPKCNSSASFDNNMCCQTIVTGSAKKGHNCTRINLQYKALNTLGEILAYY